MEQEIKRKKPSTSCTVRNKWNAKHYDRVNVTLPKGYGDMFKDFCEERGTTMNATISSIIQFELEKWEAEQ